MSVAETTKEIVLTKGVIDHHLKCFDEGNLNGILSDYAPDAVLFTPDGPLRGVDAIRPLFQAMIAEFGKPGAAFNMKLQSELGKPANQLTNVQCVTCHRGVAIPKQLVTIMMETAGKDGVNKAVQQYQELRKQYYGAQAYDFSDATLFNAANQSLMANKPDDAIAFGQLNLAFHANSARTYQVMAQAYQRKMDKDKAIQSLEKAVQIDPMNQGFKNQLQQLKAGA